jgi:hypothetical protein
MPKFDERASAERNPVAAPSRERQVFRQTDVHEVRVIGGQHVHVVLERARKRDVEEQLQN